MPEVTIIRLVSLLAVVLLRAAVPNTKLFETIVLSVAFAHYALSTWYARGRIGQGTQAPMFAFALLALAVTAAVPFVLGVPIFAWFAVHHMFNEVYTPKRDDGAVLVTGARRALGLALHGLVFFCLYKTRTLFSTQVFWAGLSAACAVFVAYVLSVAFILRELSWRERIEHCSGECLAMLCLALSFIAPINLFHIAAYHFAFWMIYPALRMPSRTLYVLQTVLLTGAMLLLTHWMSRPAMFAAFSLLTFAHVQVSFALSAINPIFMKRFFDTLGRKTNVA